MESLQHIRSATGSEYQHFGRPTLQRWKQNVVRQGRSHVVQVIQTRGRSGLAGHHAHTVAIGKYGQLRGRHHRRIQAQARGMAKRHDRALYRSQQTQRAGSIIQHPCTLDGQGLAQAFELRKLHRQPQAGDGNGGDDDEQDKLPPMISRFEFDHGHQRRDNPKQGHGPQCGHGHEQEQCGDGQHGAEARAQQIIEVHPVQLLWEFRKTQADAVCRAEKGDEQQQVNEQQPQRLSRVPQGFKGVKGQ